MFHRLCYILKICGFAHILRTSIPKKFTDLPKRNFQLKMMRICRSIINNLRTNKQKILYYLPFKHYPHRTMLLLVLQIRDSVFFCHPGSRIRDEKKFQIPDPGCSKRLLFLRNYYQFFGLKIFFDGYPVLGSCQPWIRDPEWKNRIRQA